MSGAHMGQQYRSSCSNISRYVRRKVGIET